MSSRDKTIALIGALALVLLMLTFVGYATLAGRSVESVLPVMGGFATPVVVTLLAHAAGERRNARLEQKVNGNYDQLVEMVEHQATELAKAKTIRAVETGAIPIAPASSADLARDLGLDLGAAGRHRLTEEDRRG